MQNLELQTITQLQNQLDTLRAITDANIQKILTPNSSLNIDNIPGNWRLSISYAQAGTLPIYNGLDYIEQINFGRGVMQIGYDGCRTRFTRFKNGSVWGDWFMEQISPSFTLHFSRYNTATLKNTLLDDYIKNNKTRFQSINLRIDSKKLSDLPPALMLLNGTLVLRIEHYSRDLYALDGFVDLTFISRTYQYPNTNKWLNVFDDPLSGRTFRRKIGIYKWEGDWFQIN